MEAGLLFLRVGPAIGLLILLLVLTQIAPAFATARNIGNLLAQSAVISVLAIGQLLVIVTRGIDLSVDSLATAYATTINRAKELTGRRIQAVHVVGGGAKNDTLNRLTATATGLPIHAGPVDATAVGNVLVQARAAGAVEGGLDELRRLVRETHKVSTHPV